MDCTTKGIWSCLICPLDEKISDARYLTLDGKDFLAFNNRGIIGFATEDSLRLLRESTDRQSDSTFKTAPKLFHQLYTLHVIPNSKCEDMGLVFNPPKLRLDYEAEPIGVANELCPACQISGCNFYFN